MADNRKYYYLKLKEDFFDSDELKILESQKDGYLYSNILLKLYLKSLSNAGRLMFRNVIPYTPEVLATLTGHQVGTVEKALDVFKRLGLIEVLDNGAIYMMDIQNFIGQSSSEADRQREYYNRMKAEKDALADPGTPKALPEVPVETPAPAEPKSNKAIKGYTSDFEEFWLIYPRKADKAQAYKKYKARLEDGFSHEQLLLIDGYVAGVFGISKMAADSVFVWYVMKVPHKTYRLGRLCYMLAQNREFVDTLLDNIEQEKVTKMRTAMLTRYPENKEVRGIMKLVNRVEDKKNGYKLTYEAELVEGRTEQQTLQEWLRRENEWQKNRAKASSKSKDAK